jgi:hypothetical protein
VRASVKRVPAGPSSLLIEHSCFDRRRGWDSNPRDASRRLAVFKTAPFNHSGTPPKARVSLAPARSAFPGCAELLENRWDRIRAASVLEVLHDREQDAGRDGCSVQRVHGLQPAVFPPVTDVEAPGLVVGRIRG